MHFNGNAIFSIFGGDFFFARSNGLYSVNFALNPINFADKLITLCAFQKQRKTKANKEKQVFISKVSVFIRFSLFFWVF